MTPKPTICRDCPLYGDGMGFVPDQIVPDSELVVLAQNPGEDEEAGRQIVGWEQVGHRTHAIYKPCPPLPALDQYVQLLQEVLAGERVRFMYLMPYRF